MPEAYCDLLEETAKHSDYYATVDTMQRRA